MRKLMFNGRVPNRPVRPTLDRPSIPNQPTSETQISAPIPPTEARQLILEHRAWDNMRVTGHLNLSNAPNLNELPHNLTCASLDISDCPNLTTLPPGLHVTHWIELAGSGISDLPPGHGFILHWRGIRVDDPIAFSQSLTGQYILNTENVELRRILIERLGYEKFLEQVGGTIRDRDTDRGGDRQLIYVPLEDDEPLMMLKVTCPSTGHLHLLRVPPHMRSCHQAAAWTAGFNNPDDYDPLIET